MNFNEAGAEVARLERRLGDLSGSDEVPDVVVQIVKTYGDKADVEVQAGLADDAHTSRASAIALVMEFDERQRAAAGLQDAYASVVLPEARWLTAEQRQHEALSLLKSVQSAFPVVPAAAWSQNVAESSLLVAILSLASGEFEECIDAVTAFLDSAANNRRLQAKRAQALWLLCQALTKNGAPAEALHTILTQTIDVSVESSDPVIAAIHLGAHYERGHVRVVQGYVKGAIKDLEAVVSHGQGGDRDSLQLVFHAQEELKRLRARGRLRRLLARD